MSTWNEEMQPMVVDRDVAGAIGVATAVGYWNRYELPMIVDLTPVPASAHVANGGAR